jgi:biotin carboxyl carrier protein
MARCWIAGAIAMKLRVAIDGEEALLELEKDSAQTSYSLEGALSETGKASLNRIAAGVWSVLLGRKSVTVAIEQNANELEVWVRGRRYSVSIGDLRDRPSTPSKHSSSGPMEVWALMPGKVVSVLVENGASVQAGQGLIVVEAMKMQNETKSPKDGVVSAIYVASGSTVAAGEKLMVVE